MYMENRIFPKLLKVSQDNLRPIEFVIFRGYQHFDYQNLFQMSDKRTQRELSGVRQYGVLGLIQGGKSVKNFDVPNE